MKTDGVLATRPPGTVARPTPTWDEATVVAHTTIGGRYHRIRLATPSIAARALAGQFVMITVAGPSGDRVLLPRPMAIHRRHAGGDIDIVFGVAGHGTRLLARAAEGDRLLVTGPLGRGFEIPGPSPSVLLVGRGIGVGAVMTVAEDAAAAGLPVTAVLSAATRAAVIGVDDAAELGAAAVPVADDDGTSAVGLIEATLRERLGHRPPGVIMVCGSHRLTRLSVRLGREWAVPVQVSVEAHMACGLGYCHGCAAPVPSVPDREGPLVCVDGPVFDALSEQEVQRAAAGRD